MNLKTKEKDIIAKEGYPIICGSLICTFASAKMGLKYLSIVTGIGGLFSVYFFRNPSRKPPNNPKAILSPADGKIISVTTVYERFFLKKEVKRISIFMSLFDVHVNRAPTDGEVISTIHKNGEFLAAFKEEASTVNEQTAILFETKDKRKVVVVQIAGLVARRVVTYTKPGSHVNRGEIIGMIKFGSRLDVYIEDAFESRVKLNQKVKAGESILGFLK